MTTPASERAKLFIEQCAAIYLDTLRQCGDVAAEAADDADNARFGLKEWVRTMTRLCDIAVFNGADFAGTVLAGPGASSAPRVSCCEQAPVPGDVARPCILSIEEDLRLPGTSEFIPRARIRFDPTAGRDAKLNPLGRLPTGAATFQLVVATPGLSGGTYVGKVRVHPQGAGADDSQDAFVPAQFIW